VQTPEAYQLPATTEKAVFLTSTKQSHQYCLQKYASPSFPPNVFILFSDYSYNERQLSLPFSYMIHGKMLKMHIGTQLCGPQICVPRVYYVSLQS
jgi:hypothetical protein